MGTFDLAPSSHVGLRPAFSWPTGVLENSTSKDRPAVQKAKMLYRSCMNESECGVPPAQQGWAPPCMNESECGGSSPQNESGVPLAERECGGNPYRIRVWGVPL